MINNVGYVFWCTLRGLFLTTCCFDLVKFCVLIFACCLRCVLFGAGLRFVWVYSLRLFCGFGLVGLIWV